MCEREFFPFHCSLKLAIRLGTFYNATRGDANKENVEEWASKTYPSAWKDLISLGYNKSDKYSPKVYKVERQLRA